MPLEIRADRKHLWLYRISAPLAVFSAAEHLVTAYQLLHQDERASLLALTWHLVCGAVLGLASFRLAAAALHLGSHLDHKHNGS